MTKSDVFSPFGNSTSVTTDGEMIDALSMAQTVGEQKLLRLYLVPRGTNPSLAASTAPRAAQPAPDWNTLMASLAGNQGNNGANPLIDLLSSLLTPQQQQQSANGAAGCPYLHSRPEEGRVHMFYVCDGCEVNPIVGNLHQCDVCQDYHLCDACRNAGVHKDSNHTFTVNPPRRHMGGPRWRRHSHHHPHANPQAQSQPAAPAKPQGFVPPSQPSAAQTVLPPFGPSAPIPTNVPQPVPQASPVKPPVPVVNVPINSPVKKPGIVETTPTTPVKVAPQVQVAPTEKYEMTFLTDVTVPDGSEMPAGETFNKVWRLSNSGTTTWPLGCSLRLESNTSERLSSVEHIEIPGEVPPGSAVTISVEMEAPKKAGRHVSYWRMYGPSNQPFGSRIWVDVISKEKPQQPSAPAPEVVVPAPVVQLPAPAADPYADQLDSLFRMGFMNVELNKKLLDQYKGNVNAVVDRLCSMLVN